MEDRFQVGVITSTHGIKGEVKVFPTTDNVKRFKKNMEIILDTGKENIQLTVESVKFFKQFVILKFKIWAVVTIIFFLLSAFCQNRVFKTKGREFAARKLVFMDKSNSNILCALKNIKDIKIFSKEKYFYDEYKKNMEESAHLDIAIEFLNSIPQNILEICI